MAFLALGFEYNAAQTNSHEDGKEDYSGKVAVIEGANNVGGNNLLEDSLIDRVTERNLGRTRTLGDKSLCNVFNDKIDVGIIGSILVRTRDGSIVDVFGKEKARIGASQLDVRRRRFCLGAFIRVQAHEHQGGHASKESCHDSRSQIESDDSPADRTCFAYSHHFHDGDDHIDKDERQHKAFQRSEEEISNQTNPLHGNFLAFRIFWLPEGEPDAYADTNGGKDENRQDTITVDKAAESPAAAANTASLLDHLFFLFFKVVLEFLVFVDRRHLAR
mmetsp:Transcript_1432/g.2483  ORF Transcript_1432/g.2483 Transcript_1432/m.2483 type:complete len:275 (+) Transcript_1432:1000-1824(+)